MKDTGSAISYKLTSLDRSDWLTKVLYLAEDHGHAHSIGMNYHSLLVKAGRNLLVTFEAVNDVRQFNDDAAPLGWGFAQSHEWSSLTILSESDTDWFRHPAVYGYFDRMIDDGFFDDYDQVLFYGAGPSGYGAAAFSVAAPDANVLLIQPQATLDVAKTRWDHRYPEARRLDFTNRFGYAPEMLETAQNVVVVHDPSVVEDAMHASLFDGDNTTHLSCPYLGPDAQRALSEMEVLPELIELAMSGALTTQSFAKIWRARRTHVPYLRTLMHHLEAEDHDALLLRLCRHANRHSPRPVFANKLAELEKRGVTI